MPIFIAIVGYVFVASVVGTMCYRSLRKRPSWGDSADIAGFFAGVLWPLTLVILGGVYTGQALGRSVEGG